MGDRGNIVVIQDSGRKEQVWFYAHWSGWRMPAVLQHAIREGKGRWQDPTYFARVVFCRLVPPNSHYYEDTSFGIGAAIGDNEYPIMVADCAKQIVFEIPESSLTGDGKVPHDYQPTESWTFDEYSKLEKLPRGTMAGHLKEIGFNVEKES